MPQKDKSSGDYVISESGNWNVAAQFSKSKIMDPLDRCDVYENLARYGYSSIMEQLIEYNVPNNETRFIGLQRLIDELLRIYDNTYFAMKKGKTGEELTKFAEDLERIKKLLLPCKKIIKNRVNRTTMMKLDDEKFKIILDVASSIKRKILSPLNKNHLIFTDKEEFDPVAFKNRKKDRMINKG